MFGNIGPWELILILGIVLIIFGPGKLPKIGEALGHTVVSFKRARTGEKAVDVQPADEQQALS